jgi:hypothetical protein
MKRRRKSLKPATVTRIGLSRPNLDYLEDVKPIKYTTLEAFNSTYIYCKRHIKALHALGENVNGYGRDLAPKVFHVFPDDICSRWIFHAKPEGISEGDILQLMEFLGEEVDGALNTQKICGKSSSLSSYPSTASTLHVNDKSVGSARKTTKGPDPFEHSAILAAIGLRIVKRSRTSPSE